MDRAPFLSLLLMWRYTFYGRGPWSETPVMGPSYRTSARLLFLARHQLG